MLGMPSIIPSIAAETVPEQMMSVPKLGPWLIPERTKSGGLSSKAHKASFTQSAGVPEQAQAWTAGSKIDSIISARMGWCRVRPWPVADRSLSGQTTLTW